MIREEVFISVDIEASGPIPGEFSLLSIGACAVGDSTKTFYVQLKPLNNNFNKKAMEVNKLSLEDLEINGEKPVKAMGKSISVASIPR